MAGPLKEQLNSLLSRKRDIRVLAVGTGAGDVDMDFLKTIEEVAGEVEYSVTYQVVEPNASNVEHFKKIVDGKFPAVTFQWHTGTFEDYVETYKADKSPSKFDFIHFVRMFYHVDTVSTLTITMKTFKANGGFVAVVGEAENAFWPKNMHFIAKHSLVHDCLTVNGPVSDLYFLPGWHRLSKENGWKSSTYTSTYDFDVTPIFDPENQDGNYLMDFCFHVVESRKNIGKEIVNDFMKFLENETVKENDRIIFKCELGAILIS